MGYGDVKEHADHHYSKKQTGESCSLKTDYSDNLVLLIPTHFYLSLILEIYYYIATFCALQRLNNASVDTACASEVQSQQESSRSTTGRLLNGLLAPHEDYICYLLLT